MDKTNKKTGENIPPVMYGDDVHFTVNIHKRHIHRADKLEDDVAGPHGVKQYWYQEEYLSRVAERIIHLLEDCGEPGEFMVDSVELSNVDRKVSVKNYPDWVYVDSKSIPGRITDDE